MDPNDKKSNIVLFSRSNQGEEQEDVWDDRALIRAYDRSIRKIKKEISDKLEPKLTDIGSKNGLKKIEQKSEKVETTEFEEEDEVDEEGYDEDDDFDEENEGYYDEDAENDPSSNSEPQNLSKKKNQNDWKVEDLCMAVYSEDGLLYPANIIKIIDGDEERQKCIVKYLYYFNEEEQFLDELYEYNDSESKKTKDIGAVEKKVVKKSEEKEVKSNSKDAFDFSKFPSSISNPPPPLPFEMLSPNENVSKEDALNSMLLSWYMNGYHTGYYFGLMQAERSKNKKSLSKPKE